MKIIPLRISYGHILLCACDIVVFIVTRVNKELDILQDIVFFLEDGLHNFLNNLYLSGVVHAIILE